VEQAFQKHKKKVRRRSFLAGDHIMIQAGMVKKSLKQRQAHEDQKLSDEL
jgi:hypothetical protein